MWVFVLSYLYQKITTIIIIYYYSLNEKGHLALISVYFRMNINPLTPLFTFEIYEMINKTKVRIIFFKRENTQNNKKIHSCLSHETFIHFLFCRTRLRYTIYNETSMTTSIKDKQEKKYNKYTRVSLKHKQTSSKNKKNKSNKNFKLIFFPCSSPFTLILWIPWRMLVQTYFLIYHFFFLVCIFNVFSPPHVYIFISL